MTQTEFPPWAPAKLVEMTAPERPDAEIARRLLLGDEKLEHAWRWLLRNSNREDENPISERMGCAQPSVIPHDQGTVIYFIVQSALVAQTRADLVGQQIASRLIENRRHVIDTAERLMQLLEGDYLDDAPGKAGRLEIGSWDKPVPADDTVTQFKQNMINIGVMKPRAKSWRSAEPALKYTDILADLIENANREREFFLKRIVGDYGRLSTTHSLRSRVFILTMDQDFFMPYCGKHLYGIAATIARAVLQDPSVSAQTVRNALSSSD